MGHFRVLAMFSAVELYVDSVVSVVVLEKQRIIDNALDIVGMEE